VDSIGLPWIVPSIALATANGHEARYARAGDRQMHRLQYRLQGSEERIVRGRELHRANFHVADKIRQHGKPRGNNNDENCDFDHSLGVHRKAPLAWTVANRGSRSLYRETLTDPDFEPEAKNGKSRALCVSSVTQWAQRGVDALID
jgi:hypothetical protein